MSEYNGWSNRSTWLVPLWVDNDFRSYQIKCGLLDVLQNPVTPEIAKEIAVRVLGTDLGGAGTDGVIVDDVNWCEIAEAFETDRVEA